MNNQQNRQEKADRVPSLLFELQSILERIDLAKWFPSAQPLEVELGCGDGSFLANYAAAYPERNLIGVERLLGRIRKLDRKGCRAGLRNLRGVRIESTYLIKYLLPQNSADALHIYFPDPWPKRRHWKNRMVNENFPQLAVRALTPGGMVFLRTDDESYFEQMISVFGASREFKDVETPSRLMGFVTDFEKAFQSRGIQTLRAAYKRI